MLKKFQVNRFLTYYCQHWQQTLGVSMLNWWWFQKKNCESKL